LEFDPDVWAKVGQLIVREIEESSIPVPESKKKREFDWSISRNLPARHSARRP